MLGELGRSAHKLAIESGQSDDSEGVVVGRSLEAVADLDLTTKFFRNLTLQARLGRSRLARPFPQETPTRQQGRPRCAGHTKRGLGQRSQPRRRVYVSSASRSSLLGARQCRSDPRRALVEEVECYCRASDFVAEKLVDPLSMEARHYPRSVADKALVMSPTRSTSKRCGSARPSTLRVVEGAHGLSRHDHAEK